MAKKPKQTKTAKPIDKELLTTEEAVPTVTGVRNLLPNYQTSGLNPRRVASILRQADQGDAMAYLEMAEEIEEKDTHYIAVLGTRKRAVAQLEITVIAVSDDDADIENAKFVEDWLTRDRLEEELFDILDAVGKGYSATEIIWEHSGDAWIPARLEWKPPQWFEFSPLDGKTLMLKTDDGLKTLEPYKYIVHKSASKSGLPIRGGLVRPCIWMWLFKNFSIKDWVVFAEAYGQPVRVGKYQAGASEEDRRTLMRAVSNIGSDAAAIIPQSMVIEFIEAGQKTGSAEVFERLCKYCDEQISKAVLGQTTTTDAKPGGGLAGNQAHNDVRGDIERSDANQLAATLNQQIIQPMIFLNKGEQKRYPRLQIGRREDVNVKDVAEAAKAGWQMGLSISKSKLRDDLALPAPLDDDDVLPPPAARGSTPSPDSEVNDLSTASSQQGGGSPSAFDAAIEELASNYEEIVTPTLEMAQQALDQSASFDEFLDKLLEAATEKVNLTEATKVLLRASFAARLAGNVDAKIE